MPLSIFIVRDWVRGTLFPLYYGTPLQDTIESGVVIGDIGRWNNC